MLIALVLIVRLYDVQIVKGKVYRERAEEQYVHTVRDLFDRGDIYFSPRIGEPFAAASMQPGYVLAINATHLTDHEATYAALAQIIELDREDFFGKAERVDRSYQELHQKVTEAEADQIDALNLPGVLLYRTRWRTYGGGSLAARTIGFIGYRGDALKGIYGLERYYDDILSRDNTRLSVNFFAEIFGNVRSLGDETLSHREGHIVTSIEPTVARMLDTVLTDAQNTWDSRLTGGIIINPKTGDIYAMNVVPTFDLNDRSGLDISSFGNPLVESVYEMGSIIKPLTMAIGLDRGVVTPSTTYYDAGFLELDGFTIRNFDGRGRGTVPMQEVLSQSLNTGVAHVVQLVGKDTFRTYFSNLKLGSETGIDLPSEAHGLVDNLDSPRDIEYATASFGQGIAMTPIATVRALSTLANGGMLITPHIVQEIQYETGEVHEVGFPEGEQIFAADTSETLTRMLVKVVDEALRDGTVALPRYTIAAKTGTAQIADPQNGGYYDDRFLHSFFGYFPAYDPEFLIFLYTVEPKGVRYASETMTAPFMELTQFLINYYNIPPDR